MCRVRGPQHLIVSVALEPVGSIDVNIRDMEEQLELALYDTVPGIKNMNITKMNGMLVANVFVEHVQKEFAAIQVKDQLALFDFNNSYLNTSTFKVSTKPVLAIQRIEVSETVPTAEGITLVLACVVQGPENLKVTWYKSGAVIHINGSRQRIWSTTIPPNSEDQHTSLLGFDRTHVLDTGEFTCSATDGTDIRNVTVPITVRSTPLPQLLPLTATVLQGEPMAILCQSTRDDFWNFRYSWLKNGKRLDPIKDREVAEDLFPSGSRIHIDPIQQSATYTCILSSEFGTTSSSSVVTVTPKDGFQALCNEDTKWNVKWSIAAPDTSDIQVCPLGYTGFARRRCTKNKLGQTVWENPDFSGCLSGGILYLKKHFDSLKMGYRQKTVDYLLTKLWEYLITILSRMKPSEGDTVVDLLVDAHQMDPYENFKEDSWKVFLDIASILLGNRLVSQSKPLARLLEVVINTTSTYSEKLIKSRSLHKCTHYTTCIVAKIRRLKASNATAVTFWPDKFLSSANSDFNMTWLLDSVHVAGENATPSGGRISRMIGVVFHCFDPQWSFMFSNDELINGEEESEIVAGITSVIIAGEEIINENFVITLIFKRVLEIEIMEESTSISCAAVDFSNRVLRKAREVCDTIFRDENFTVCECYGQNSYTLLSTKIRQVPSEPQVNLNIITIVGSAICIVFTTLTVITVIVCNWKKMTAVVLVKIHTCTSIITAHVVMIVALCIPNCQVCQGMYPEVFHIFLLKALSFQTCLVLLVFMELKNMWSSLHPCCVAMLIGWGMPLLYGGALALATYVSNGQLNRVWILVDTSTEICIFSISTLIVLSIHLTLSAIIHSRRFRNSLCNPQDIERTWKNKMRSLHLSMEMNFCLSLLAVSSILRNTSVQYVSEYLMSCSSVFVGFSAPLCYIFWDRKIE